MDRDELLAEIARLDQQNEAFRRAIGSFRWVGNNLHNAGKPKFEEFFLAALDDAKEAMGDDWEPMRLRRG